MNEREQCEKCGEDYFIDCPKCGEVVEVLNVCQMPWCDGDGDIYECPHCGKRFEVKPKYKFLGFYTYTDEFDDCRDEAKDLLNK